MINYSSTYQFLKTTELSDWVEGLKKSVDSLFLDKRWGDLPKWINALEQMPHANASLIDLNQSVVTIGRAEDVTQSAQEQMKALLQQFFPWRKGPFNLFGIDIDTEWRSDLKWDRLKSALGSLEDQLVLDIGCGSGYHCWRMKGAGARAVVGIDPTMLYPLQFQVFQKYVQDPSVNVFPLGIDGLPQVLPHFDTVFSMGLLYHRRSPLDHLLHMKELLKPKGRLFLETLVIDGQRGDVLSPTGRYAKMPNVWFIPSCATLAAWLERTGFKNIEHLDTTVTTSREQRVTSWMASHSLEHFLDPQNPSLTCEGYPAPKRAIFCASR